MRFFSLIIFLFVATACQGTHSDDGDPKICCGSSPSQMVFKTHGGREIVTWNEISALDVTIKADPVKHTDELQRSFDREKAKAIVRQLDFANPRQLGYPSGLITGTMTVHYVHPGFRESTRQFVIQDQGLLQDSVFLDVTYEPDLTLDRAWLEAQ